jgi:cation transport ATPase
MDLSVVCLLIVYVLRQLCLQDFFETCAMLITVIILGKYLECAAKGKTSAAIQSLMSLAPDTANLVTLDEQGHVLTEDIVESALIHHGDLLKVRHCGVSCCVQASFRRRVQSQQAGRHM